MCIGGIIQVHQPSARPDGYRNLVTTREGDADSPVRRHRPADGADQVGEVPQDVLTNGTPPAGQAFQRQRLVPSAE
jgi:hypothetical protein